MHVGMRKRHPAGFWKKIRNGWEAFKVKTLIWVSYGNMVKSGNIVGVGIHL